MLCVCVLFCSLNSNRLGYVKLFTVVFQAAPILPMHITYFTNCHCLQMFSSHTLLNEFPAHTHTHTHTYSSLHNDCSEYRLSLSQLTAPSSDTHTHARTRTHTCTRVWNQSAWGNAGTVFTSLHFFWPFFHASLLVELYLAVWFTKSITTYYLLNELVFCSRFPLFKIMHQNNKFSTRLVFPMSTSLSHTYFCWHQWCNF